MPSFKVGNIDDYVAELRAKGIEVDVGPSRTSLPTKRGPHADGIHVGGERKWGETEKDDSATIHFALPMRTVSITNMGGKLRDKLSLKAEQKAMLAEELARHESKRAELAGPCTIILKRVSSRTLDSDNLPGAFKTPRDIIAQFLRGGKVGEMDDDPSLTWAYEQGKIGNAKGIIVSIKKTQMSAVTSSSQ